MRALPSPGLEAKGRSWMLWVGRTGKEREAEARDSLDLPERIDSPKPWGDGDRGGAGKALLSCSAGEKETVFLRFLRGGTRTTGDDGRGYGGEDGRLGGAAVASALLLFASSVTERARGDSIRRECDEQTFQPN